MRKLDNRTYIILLAVSTIFWFLFYKNNQIHLSVALNALLLIYIREYKKTVKFVITYIAMIILASLFAGKIALMYIILNMLARSIPLIMVVTCIVVGNSSELMSSLQKIRVPKFIIVMVCIMIRFFPVLSKESVAIRNGMKARGICQAPVFGIRVFYYSADNQMYKVVRRTWCHSGVKRIKCR